jgi:hypothetical protein
MVALRPSGLLKLEKQKHYQEIDISIGKIYTNGG